MAKDNEQTKSPASEASDTRKEQPRSGDAIATLKADHRQVERFFAEYDDAETDRKQELVDQICKALTIHTLLEEEIFYPACREEASDEEPLDEAQVEHDSAKMLIAELRQGDRSDPYRDAKVKVLAEQIRHHVAEEEKPRTGIFAKARQAGLDTPRLAGRIRQRKTQLEAGQDLPAGRPVSFTQFPQAKFAEPKESTMASYQHPRERERDDRGRFMEDDMRGGRGRDRDDDRGYSSRGSNDRNRDEEGRFTSNGNGRYGSGRDDDDRRSGRGEGRSWYGDSRGHAEAARRGWDERDDGRHGSRDYDDDRSYRSRSSGRYDDDDRDDRSRGRGQGGWFGDSEGHAEAARRGWDDRGSSSRSSRGGYDDDDDDRRGRSGRGGRSDDDDRDHGGWFGDPRGHAEAARRGWENRR